MLQKTIYIIICLSFLLTTSPLLAQSPSPYPLLNEKQNFLEAEEYFMNKADFVLASQLYREVYDEVPVKANKARAYVGLRLAFALCHLKKTTEALALLESIEKTIPEEGEENLLLLADLYTYRAKAYAIDRKVDESLSWNDRAMVIKETYYPELHPKFAESYAAYVYVHNYFTFKMLLVKEYLALEKAVLEAHPEAYPKYDRVAFHYNMCSYYSEQGEYLKASTQGKKAIQLLDPFKDLHLGYLSNCYALMGTIYLKMEDTDPAIDYIKKALTFPVITCRDSVSRAITYTNLGYAYSLSGDHETASIFMKKALTYYGQKNNAYLAYSYTKLAEHYLEYPDIESQKSVLDTALYYTNKSIEFNELIFPNRNINKIGAYVAKGDFCSISNNHEEGLIYYQKALSNCLSTFDSHSIDDIPSLKESINGYLVETILLKKAYALFQIAKKNNTDIPLIQALAINSLVDSLHKIKKKYYYDEYSIINHPNLQKIYGINLEIISLLNERNPNQENMQLSLDYMEQVKGNMLLRNLSDLKQSKFFGVPDSLISKNQKISSKINDYLRLHPEDIAANSDEILNSNDTIFQLVKQKSDLELFFKENYSSYYHLRFDPSTPNISEIQDNLKGSTLIEFYWSLDHIFALKINQRESILHKIPINNQLVNLIKSHIEFLKENSKDGFLNFQQNAYQLYIRLLEPILEKEIPSKLIIIPDGPLASFPFESLLTSESNFKTTNYRELPYLVKASAVSYAYSTSTLLQSYTNSTIIDSPRVLAFSFSSAINTSSGNDVLREYNLFPLAGAVDEINSIGKLIPSDRFKAFYGNNATKDAFFTHYGNYDVIHLAVHAQSDHSNRFNNRIFFHPKDDNTNNENYICFAHELYNLSPSPRLVVLGACNTGAGKNYIGEGIYSTARGFIYAGTPSVVMSLWPLSDQASKEISSRFYSKLLNGTPIDEALQESKISFIESADEWTAHPSRWAALNIIGSAKPIVNKKSSLSYWGIFILCLIIAIALFNYYYNSKN